MDVFLQHRRQFGHTIHVNRKKIFQLHHIQQQERWDCGIACLEMVFRSYGYTMDRDQLIQFLNGTRSIWTIDLAFCVLRFLTLNSSHVCCSWLFCTAADVSNLNPDYETMCYYSTHYALDIVRIYRLFAAARSQDIAFPFAPKILSTQEVIEILKRKTTCIVALIDSQYLSCPCVQSPQDENRSKGEFVGHFIVLWSIVNINSCERILYSNPASHVHPECIMSTNELNEARSALGTDNEVLIFDFDFCKI